MSQKDETTQLLTEKYGLVLRAEQVAELWGITVSRLTNLISSRAFPVPSSGRGKQRRWDVRDVARYWDERRKQAQIDFEREQELMQ